MSYWIDIIDEIVTSVQDDSDNALASDEPFYMHGHPLEIIDLLNQKDKHLVMLHAFVGLNPLLGYDALHRLIQ